MWFLFVKQTRVGSQVWLTLIGLNTGKDSKYGFDHDYRFVYDVKKLL